MASAATKLMACTLPSASESSPEVAAALIDTALDRFGGVDILVNSTGSSASHPFLEQTEDQFEEAVNSIHL